VNFHRARATVLAEQEIIRQVMATFPFIEEFRAELRQRDYPRLSEAECAAMRWDFTQGMANNAIEDLHPPPELVAFIDLLVDERVPQEVSDEFFDRFAVVRLGAKAPAGEVA